MWKTNNAVSMDQFRRMRDLILKYISNNYYNSIIWKSSTGHLLPGLNLHDLYEQIFISKGVDVAKQFYKEAQELAYKIATGNRAFFPFLQGATMGIGGIFLHANAAVTTESTRVASPGNGYGFVATEAGFTFLFSKLPSRLSEYYLVTGKSIETTDLFHLNLALYFMPTDRAEPLELSLSKIDNTDLTTVLDKVLDFVDHPNECNIEKYFDSIERCFSKNTITEIMEELEREVDHVEWAQNTLERMRLNCPTSMAISLKAARMARYLSLEECLEMEYNIICRRLETDEFKNGLLRFRGSKNAKDWDPLPESVDEYFEPIPGNEKLNLVRQDPGIRMEYTYETERLKYRDTDLAHIYLSEVMTDEMSDSRSTLKDARKIFNNMLIDEQGAYVYQELKDREDMMLEYMCTLEEENLHEVSHEKQD